MMQVAGTGRKGIASFLIVNDDDMEYSATVITPDITYEIKCSCWDAAQKWVDNMIINIEEMGHETGRDF